jgi:hypothetical protein
VSALYNFDDLNCPRCYRRASLTQAADVPDRYECRPGCGARFQFIPATNDRTAALEHDVDDTPYNAGARIADDWRCPSCSARGFTVVCPSCTQDLYSGARR